MSDKKWKLTKHRTNRKPKHTKTTKGTDFPRQAINKFEGTRLGMSKWLHGNCGRSMYNVKWDSGRSHLRRGKIEGLINKFIGKPYNELLGEFRRRTKKFVGVEDYNLNWYIYNVPHKWHRYWNDYSSWYKYCVDSNGILIRNPEYKSRRKLYNRLESKYLKYNREHQLPNLGEVRDHPSVISRQECAYWGSNRRTYYEGNLNAKGRQIIYLGEYYIPVKDGEPQLIKVYSYEKAYEYLMMRFPYKNDIPIREKYEKEWALISIPSLNQNQFIFKDIPNPRKADLISSLQRFIDNDKKMRYGVPMTELDIQLTIADYEQRIKNCSDTITAQVGMGRVHTLVRKSDIAQ